MKILIVTATELELNALKSAPLSSRHELDFAVHGVGMIPATFRLAQFCRGNYSLIIQCGLAGSYEKTEPGESFLIGREWLESGAEDHEKILSMFDLGFADTNGFPFQDEALPCPWISSDMPFNVADSLTVALGSGNANTIAKRRKKFPQVDLESLEGAALHYACLSNKIPFLQLRSVSNFVEPRNREAWHLDIALRENAESLRKLLLYLDTKMEMKEDYDA